MNTRKLVVASLALAGALAAGASQAGPNVQWSVTIGGPGLGVYLPAPAPVVVAPWVVVAPPVVAVPRYRYVSTYPTRWDVDGDGIPNRYDRVYNPRWDRDGDGIPNRYDHYERHGGRHHDRDGDGIPDRYEGRYGRGR